MPMDRKTLHATENASHGMPLTFSLRLRNDIVTADAGLPGQCTRGNNSIAAGNLDSTGGILSYQKVSYPKAINPHIIPI